MATTKLYLDTRRDAGQENPLRVNITHFRKIAAITLGVKLKSDQWDSVSKTVVNHPEERYWNNYIAKKKVEIDTIILKLEDEEPHKIASMTAVQIRDYVVKTLNPDEELKPSKPKVTKKNPKGFLTWFDRFMERKTGRTYDIYKATRKRLEAWLGSEEALAKVKFEDIKVTWLEDFEDFLSLTATANSNAIHFRNIRTVVNYAIDNDVTSYYAFRRFKIKSSKTRKRNFDALTLRKIFNHQCSEEWQQKYLDFFKLTFLLIGINVVDLCSLEKITAGRVEYIRAKTHRPYSIKVEKEALEIINKYRGEKSLLDFVEKYQNYRHFFNNLSKGLNEIKTQLGLEELTTYWARHSWATIARKLKISKDTIALALGHGGNSVTDIYIEADMQEVDEANRKVIDYVLYGNAIGMKKVKSIRKPTKQPKAS